MGLVQRAATLGAMEITFTTTRTLPRFNRVPPRPPACVSSHQTVPTPPVLRPTTRRAYVGLSNVLQVQDYIVTSQTTNVVLFQHVLKPTVLLQTTQRVFVAPRRALQIQVCIVTSRATNVELFHHALKQMVLQ